MNDMPAPLTDWLGGILRHFLTILSGYMVAHGISDQASTTALIAWAIPGLLGILWSLYQKYVANKKFAVALALPAGSTPADVSATLAAK